MTVSMEYPQYPFAIDGAVYRPAVRTSVKENDDRRRLSGVDWLNDMKRVLNSDL